MLIYVVLFNFLTALSKFFVDNLAYLCVILMSECPKSC